MIAPLTPVGQSLTLFLAPFLHEDVALVMAATFVHRFQLPALQALGALYAGVVASDAAVFGVGRAARRLPVLRRLVPLAGLEEARARLERNRVWAIAVSRLVPGLLFTTFTACGWLGMRFRDFMRPALVTSAVYTAVLFVLVLVFGEVALHWAGTLGWLLGAAAVAVVAASWGIRLAWRHVTRADPGAVGARPLVLPGMPPVPPEARRVAESERIPPWLFYIPLGLRWLWLGVRHRSLTLPALANPCIEAGGLWGESKSACLAQIEGDAARWVAPFVTVTRLSADVEAAHAGDEALARMAMRGLSFPVVVKPDVGWQGFGVQVADDAQALRRYVAAYPAGVPVIIQALSPWVGEAGVLYVREPGARSGRVTSLTLRYYPSVIGDGVSTVRQLVAREPRMRHKVRYIEGDDALHRGTGAERMAKVFADGEVVRLSFIGSIRVGGLYRDARSAITPALSARFDAIARSMPEFHFGRFDIRFASLEALRAGEQFAVFEVNGAGAEAIHMWDPEMPLDEAYRELVRYQDVIFRLGAANRARGFRPLSLRQLWRLTRRQNALIAQYPPST